MVTVRKYLNTQRLVREYVTPKFAVEYSEMNYAYFNYSLLQIRSTGSTQVQILSRTLAVTLTSNKGIPISMTVCGGVLLLDR